MAEKLVTRKHDVTNNRQDLLQKSKKIQIMFDLSLIKNSSTRQEMGDVMPVCLKGDDKVAEGFCINYREFMSLSIVVLAFISKT